MRFRKQSNPVSPLLTFFATECSERFPNERNFLVKTPGNARTHLAQAIACLPDGFTSVAKAEDERRVVELFESATCLVKIVVLRGGSVWTDLGSSNPDHADLFMHMISGNMHAMDW